jgi:AcrR family transcriptional regulator
MRESDGDKRDRIIKTSLRLFGKEGYYGTRMAEVARLARISPKTLYKYFPSKKQLFISTREAAMDALISEVFVAMCEEPPEQDSFTTIKNALKSYSDFIRKNRGYSRILAEGVVIVDKEVQADQRQSFSDAVSVIALFLDEGMREGNLKLVAGPDETALLFLSFTAILAYAFLVDLDKKSGGAFDAGYSLDLFFDVMQDRG